MNTYAEVFTPLFNKLEKEKAVAQQLHQLLQDENQALKEQDPTSILELAEKKQQLLLSLNQLSQQRKDMLLQAGLGENLQVIESQTTLPVRIHQSWNALLELIQSCQKQNWLNGTLIERGRQVTHELQKIITGRDGQNEAGIYGQNGQTNQQSARSLAQA